MSKRALAALSLDCGSNALGYNWHCLVNLALHFSALQQLDLITCSLEKACCERWETSTKDSYFFNKGQM